MSGSTIGNIFKVSTWGESHGKGLGAVVDGCPAGIPLCEEDIQKDLDRRKPGTSRFTTQRSEADRVSILSGVFEGKTTGTPISLVIMNTDQRSKDYSEIMNIYRPGHADLGYDAKYGFRDYRGGGRSSGRETAARVAAGAVARKLLAELGIEITAYTKAIGDIEIDPKNFDKDEILNNPFAMPDTEAAQRAEKFLEDAIRKTDSVGGIVECRVKGVKAGIGEPVFGKLDAAISGAIMSIGAVKGIEFGLGFEAAKAFGSSNNDEFYTDGNTVFKRTNNSGGILGGISDGADIVFRTAFKPTPSIAAAQNTIDRQGNCKEISIKGRHDPIVVARAVIVVEAMTTIVLTDEILTGMSARIENVKKYYESMKTGVPF